MIRALLSALSVLVIASPTMAQDADDWDRHHDPRERLTAAYIQTTTGLSILLRCQAGTYSAFITGLSKYEGERRPIGYAFGDDEIYQRAWMVGSDGTSAFSSRPAPFARSLRDGGTLHLLIPGSEGDARPTRYVLDLPPSSAAIDATLTACERPLVDARADAAKLALEDNGLPTELEWMERPRPTYPNNRYARGYAAVSCGVSPQGRLEDCVVETEVPHDGNFGRATLRAARDARLVNRLNPDAPIAPSLVTFETNFVVQGYDTAEDRQRTREIGEAERRERQRRRGQD